MKTKTLILWLLLSVTIPSFAYDFQSGDLYYNITDDNMVEVTYQKRWSNNYSGLTSVIIPESVTYNGTTYSVTTIGIFAFSGCIGLTSVTIPNSVTSIGDYAFEGCTGLTSITIHNSVTSIEGSAFFSCTGLTSIKVESGNAIYDSRNNCNAIIETATNTLVAGCRNTIIPNSVTTIGGSAFSGCTGLTSITIPNSVTTIGGSAFSGCTGLTSITIGNSVTSIGSSAFSGCTGLTSITIPNSVTSIGGSAFSGCIGLTSITIPNSVTSIGGSAFKGCIGLTSITIGNSVTSIGSFAFEGCIGLTSITIPNSVTSIGDYAFYGTPWYDNQPNGMIYINDILYKYKGTMPQGTSIVVKEGTTCISGNAFYGCSGLTSITIPNSVTSIGDDAFYGCSGLTSITIPNSVTSIEDNAFYGCSGLTSITIPNSVTSIGDDAFYGCSGLTSITIPNSVTSIGGSAFSGCSSLTSIIIPNSVTSIGGGAFYGTPWYDNQPNGMIYINDILYKYKGTMPQGTNITIKDGTTMIVTSAFDGCSGLTSITIPSSVTSIGSFAFDGCSGLTSIIIPNSVTSIGVYAFYGCSSLTSITILNSVTSIGGYAFYGCSSLTSVTCYATEPPSVSSNAFSGVKVDTIPLYVPMESMVKYNSSAVWKDFLVLPISAMPVDIDEPVLNPEENKVTITWPAIEDAIAYTIEISNDSALVCTLVFDAGGALKNIRYAGPAHHAPQRATHVETTGYGFRFVVEGLDYATTYTYTITATDIDDVVLTTYTGTFTTTGNNPTTGFEDIRSTQSRPEARKVLRDGQVYIIRGDKTYTVTGAEVK